jgi:hypothetical protein
VPADRRRHGRHGPQARQRDEDVGIGAADAADHLIAEHLEVTGEVPAAQRVGHHDVGAGDVEGDGGAGAPGQAEGERHSGGGGAVLEREATVASPSDLPQLRGRRLVPRNREEAIAQPDAGPPARQVGLRRRPGLGHHRGNGHQKREHRHEARESSHHTLLVDRGENAEVYGASTAPICRRGKMRDV